MDMHCIVVDGWFLWKQNSLLSKTTPLVTIITVQNLRQVITSLEEGEMEVREWGSDVVIDKRDSLASAMEETMLEEHLP
jgi:hypothetical protein